jgi:SAM-dependent methyltransferase
MTFIHPEDSHTHSLETLNQLYEYDDFMASIKTVLDLGCGLGDDLEWWATRTTRDDNPEPLNIKCIGMDQFDEFKMVDTYPNVSYYQSNFETPMRLCHDSLEYDVLWSHDSFQYCINPMGTLANWWQVASQGAMLYIGVPQTTNLFRGKQDFTQAPGCYYHHTMVSLIYQLATAGWDCSTGFFRQAPTDTWIHAVVYKSTHAPQDPTIATWHSLSELGLLPNSAVKSIHAHNYLRQQDLVVPWIDHSLMSMAVK